MPPAAAIVRRLVSPDGGRVETGDPSSAARCYLYRGIRSSRLPSAGTRTCLVSARRGRLCHLLEDLIEAEAGRLLSRRELLEARQELRDARLRGNEQVDVPEHPIE